MRTNTTIDFTPVKQPQTADSPETTARERERKRVLVCCVLLMIVMSNLSYGWALFVDEIALSFQKNRSTVQTAYSVFMFVMGATCPFAGAIADRFSPRIPMTIGSLLVGGSWVAASFAKNVPQLSIAFLFGGLGAATMYTFTIAAASKWFPDRRGFAVGMVTGGYGGGACLSVIPISTMLRRSGWETTFFTFGILHFVLICGLSFFVSFPKAPPKLDRALAETSKPLLAEEGGKKSVSTLNAVTSLLFVQLFGNMLCCVFLGNVFVTQSKSIAIDYGHQSTFVFKGVSVLEVTLTFSSLLNGVSRPFWGFVSDKIGRGNCLAISLLINFLAVSLWSLTINNPWCFALFTCLFFFSWGQIYALFPAICGDLFGPKNFSAIYGALYQTKTIGSSLAGPVAAVVNEAAGGWADVLISMEVMSLVAVVSSLCVVRPALTKQH